MSRVSRLQPDYQEVACQLISVNIFRQTSADIKFKEKLLGVDQTHKRTPTILSVQEIKSWDVPNLELQGFVRYGNKHGYATLLVPEQFCTIKRSWESEERCTAVLFGTAMVMAVYASDSRKVWKCTRNASLVRVVPRTSTSQVTSKGTTRTLEVSKNHVAWDYERS